MRAAIYLRSSKDRHDVSLNAQRRELQKLAIDEGMSIVAEYCDAVESAKDENRPGFQRLVHDLKSPGRTWTTLLMLDTSRLSRRRYTAQAFKWECRKRGVTVRYSKVPEVDPIAAVILESVFEAMDECHSLLSREKGLAGMAENVRSGYRAGGRAPYGYELEKHETGAIREGSPVTKTKLRLSDDAPIVGRYLAARAQGLSRAAAIRESGISKSPSSLVGIEWNALTYAGHTVWNVHQERIDGRYKGGQKRRPRSEWVIQENTHEALITTAEAELLVSNLQKKKRTRRVSSPYILSGLLLTPDGERWEGNTGSYRVKRKGKRGRWVKQCDVEIAVLDKVVNDLASSTFVKLLTRNAQAQFAATPEDPAKKQREQLAAMDRRITKYMELGEQLEDPAPALREIEKLERSRAALRSEIEHLQSEYTMVKALNQVTEHQVRKRLLELRQDFDGMGPNALKEALAGFIERIELDPDSLDCQVCYRIQVDSRAMLASPRGFEPLLPP